jgi:dTDP-4-dehydrorhamnose 3,5-epimerase-like enzyme
MSEMQIVGVRLIQTTSNHDQRGMLATIYRESETGTYRQWNHIASHANVLRGVHAHLDYDELYVPIMGRMFLFLKDARTKSSSFDAEMSFWSEDIQNRSLFVPRGVAHAVYFATSGVLLYGLSSPWSGAGEVTCRWDAPEIAASWPDPHPVLSSKDSNAGSFTEMTMAIEGMERSHR